MNRTDLKTALDRYNQKKQLIRSMTAESLYFETSEQQEARIEKLLQPKNYADFFEYYFGSGVSMQMADSRCAAFHIHATKELLANNMINQFRIWFRGSAKSTHTNVGNLFLLKQKKETKFAVIVGANELRANLLLADIQVHLEANERIIKDFGKQISYGDWSKGMFETTDNAYFMALGIDQPFRGLRRFSNRIDFASVDDVEDREVANNPRRVRQRAEKILSDLGGAFAKDTRRLVVSNNHITNTGIIAYLLNKIGDKKITKTNVVNIIDSKGHPSWSERYSLDYIQNLRENTDMYTWSRKYMNTPVEEGKLFRDSWIVYTKIPKLSEMDSLVIYGDLSYKDTGDYKAMVFMGKKGRDFYLIDCFVAQTTRHNCAIWLYNMYEDKKLDSYNISYMIEGLFAQDEFTNDFDLEGDNRGYYIPVTADKKTKGGKYERIEGMVGFFERGNVFISEKIKENYSTKNLINQLLAFEKGSTAHDDAPDALQSAISELNTATQREKFDIRTFSYKNKKNKHSY